MTFKIDNAPFNDLGPRPVGAYSPPDTRSALPGVVRKFSMREGPNGKLVPSGWEPIDEPEFRRAAIDEVVELTIVKSCTKYKDCWREHLQALPRLLHEHLEFSVDENLEIYQRVVKGVVFKMMGEEL